MSLETIFYCKAKETPTNPSYQQFTLQWGNQYMRVYEDESAVGTIDEKRFYSSSPRYENIILHLDSSKRFLCAKIGNVDLRYKITCYSKELPKEESMTKAFLWQYFRLKEMESSLTKRIKKYKERIRNNEE